MQRKIIKHSLLVLFSLCYLSPASAQTYIVKNVNDSGADSLRQAIIDANANVGFDNIEFNINNHASGPFSIKVTSPLPAIIDPVKIDGFTQAGDGVYAIELSGELLPAPLPIIAPAPPPVPNVNTSNYAAGLLLWGRDRAIPSATRDGTCIGADQPGCKLVKNPDGSVIKGLAINKFPRQGIYLYGADHITIIGNYLGLDTTGNKSGFFNGRQNTGGYPHDTIRIEASNNNFIGTAEEDYPDIYHASNRNVLGSSGRSFISMTYLNENIRGFNGCDPVTCRNIQISYNDNVIQGNYLGTNSTGSCIIGGAPGATYTNAVYTPLLCTGDGNLPTRPLASATNAGISMAANVSNIQANNNVIGGLKPGQGNVIVSTVIATQIAYNVNFSGNIVGRDATGTINLLGSQGSGINLTSTLNARIEKNIVARNSVNFSSPTATTAGLNITFLNTATAAFFPLHKNLSIVDNQIIDNFNIGIIAFTQDADAGLVGNGIKVGYDLINGKIIAMPNVIAHNRNSGVVIENVTAIPVPAIHLPVLYNQIYDNDFVPVSAGRLGIDLVRLPATSAALPGDGPNLNDQNDPDEGANGLQNYPVISMQDSFLNPALVKVKGTFNSEPNKDYLLQFFSNKSALCVSVTNQSPLVVVPSPQCTNPAFPFLVSQGEVFIGEQLVHTDSNGNATYSFPAKENVPVGSVLTGTATRMEKIENVLTPIETSEFSQAVDVDKKGSQNAYENAMGAAGGDKSTSDPGWDN